ncbi:zinc-dependent alcohol dehydrogenase family protein [Herbaspirillum frisingense]|uniref:zinc-dependent alcohol dehydrogenase family protein n=1 Tax=Herbaspirillum frisingense TaxID=92645 RepID=UPI001601F826|nr:zinc-dependent alcohol dehydrogenase family protein [Herbaspirillum frisingense]QNB09867.1 zinc-dependent alcohol dehydrogenase family protein [Herbaspirillum frisingense]
MSRVVEFTEYGGPEVLKIVDVVVPEPAADEVRIAVKAIGLNRAESMWRHGNYVEPVLLPARLGYEVSGYVDAVGADVTGFFVGDQVTTVPAFSQNDYGMYGELVLAPASAVIRHAEPLPHAEATTLWNVFITPYGALLEDGTMKKGDNVLIPAASSGIGLGTIQIVNAGGGVSIALTRTSAKREQLLAAGAAHVIATEEQDLVAEVMRITDGKGADIVFDPVGGPTFAKLISASAPGATLFLYGALSDEPTSLPLLEIIPKKPIIRGYNLFELTTDRKRLEAATSYILAGVANGTFKPTIARTFAFDDIVEAHRHLEKNQHFGKIVVSV